MHEAFRIDHSSYVHRAFTVYFAFAFAVRSRSAFAHRSPNSVLRSHTVRSACAHLSSGKVERFRHCISVKFYIRICYIDLFQHFPY